LYRRDVEYVVKEGQVLIVDEFTGRLMPGRRWSDGLHQAVEATEGVKIERENQTLATITLQNYFRMYDKLSGMTGTADTEAPEFLAKQKAKDKTSEEYQRILEELKAETAAASQEVKEAGGLHILGTERHESRRIDNQLRGRSGRQGDPGSSRFYLSLEDDLMRIFGGERLMAWMERLGMEEGVPIEHGMVTKSIERAQKQVEGRNFEIRKHLL